VRDVTTARPQAGAGTGLAATYARIADEGRHALVDGRTTVEPPPVDGTPRWGLSLVLRPRPPVRVLCATMTALRDTLGTHHWIYGPSTMHVTIRSIEGHRFAIGADDPFVARYRTIARDALADVPSPVLELRGLLPTAGGVLVAGYPTIDLQPLRHALFDAFSPLDVPIAGPETTRETLRDTFHASLALFGGPVADRDRLIAFLDDHRDTSFGTYTCLSASLVAYRRDAYGVSLIECGDVPFGAGQLGRVA
jgi:hypothetical protein